MSPNTFSHTARSRVLQLVFAAAALGAAGSALAAGPAVEAGGPAVEEIGMLPHEKEMVQIPAAERNPFDLGGGYEPAVDSAEDTTLQAQKIMGRLNSLSVNGLRSGEKGYKILLGDMILEEGSFVPPVVPGQTDRLKVTKIDADEIEITWVEEEDGGYARPQARVFRKRLGMDAAVMTVVRGTASAEEGGGVAVVVRKMGDLQEELSQDAVGGGADGPESP